MNRPCPHVGCLQLNSAFANFCALCGRSVIGDFTPIRHLLESGVIFANSVTVHSQDGESVSCDSDEPPVLLKKGADDAYTEMEGFYNWIKLGFEPRLQKRGITIYSPSAEDPNRRPYLLCSFTKFAVFDAICQIQISVGADLAFANPERLQWVQLLTDTNQAFLKTADQKHWVLYHIEFFIDDLLGGGSGD